MASLSSYLLDAGLLSPDEIGEARTHASVEGVRLGTSLVKLGFMTIEELAAHLSDLYSVPLPPHEWLESPDPAALKIVPSALIQEYKFLPLRLEKDQIHVALLAPDDESQLEFIQIAAAREVVPYVLPELRLFYWLEEHLGIERHQRYVNVHTSAIRLSAAAARQQSGADVVTDDRPGATRAASPLDAPLGLGRPVPGTRGDSEPWELGGEEDEELLLEEFAEPIAVEPEPAGEPAPTHDPEAAPQRAYVPCIAVPVRALEQRLLDARDRNQVADMALDIAIAYARTAAFFFVQGELVTGYRLLAVTDERVEESDIDTIAVSTLMECTFVQPARSGVAFRGRLPARGTDARLLKTIGRCDDPEVFIQAIRLKDRVVSLLYADNGDDKLGDTAMAALVGLAGLVTRGYERVIAARRDEKQGR